MSATHLVAYLGQQAKTNGLIPFLWAGIVDWRDGVPSAPAYAVDSAALDSLKASVDGGVHKLGSGVHF